jgi:hypothetical protein
LLANFVFSYVAETVETGSEKVDWRKDDVASFCGVETRTVENWMMREGFKGPHLPAWQQTTLKEGRDYDSRTLNSDEPPGRLNDQSKQQLTSL